MKAALSSKFALPSICTLCKQFHKGHQAVCHFCKDLLIPLGPACQYCAYPLPDAQHLICGNCIKKPPHFDKAYIPYVFEEPLRELLHQFKYHQGLYLSSFLVSLMLQVLPKMDFKPQCLLPVPIHKQKLKRRGFNQAAVLAKLLAQKTQIDYALDQCKKTRNTLPQASLSKEERHKNMHHGFVVQALPYSHVAIIDDLLTTGSTVNALALSLKQAGVERVDVWCCARAVLVK